MQIDNRFTAFWMDTTTAPWTPLTGLSATINIRDVNWNLVVDNQPMTELGWWHYIYTFTGYNPAVDYVYDCSPWATAYIESWVTTNTEQLISEIRVWGGFNTSGIQTSINNSKNTIIKEFDKKLLEMEKKIKVEFNDTNSHIDVAKDDILNKIDDIEIPEADVSEITNGIGVLKQRFTKLSEFLRKESDMEKEWMKKELESKIEEIEQAYEDMKLLHSEEIESKTSEVSEKEKLIAEMEETAKELMEELEKEWKVNKEEMEKEVKDKIISSLSE